MTGAISTFQYLSNTLRVIEIDGQPWFVAADVGDALSIANPRREVIKNLDQSEKRSMKLHNGIGRPNIIISESGLYKLIMRSNKPEARQFQDWVTREVLPAIRKDGGYIMGEEKVRSGEMTEDELVFKAMEVMRRKIGQPAGA